MDQLIKNFARNSLDSDVIRKRFWIKDVHDDDIHCMLKINDESFVSGSKDGKVKKWEVDFSEKSLFDEEMHSSNAWVTALCRGNNEEWFCGFRNGKISKFNIENNKLEEFELQEIVNSSLFCKAPNLNRITTLHVPYKLNKNVLYIGKPTGFISYDIQNRRPLSATIVDQNDWVYCIDEAYLNKLLVVIGSRLELWECNDENNFVKSQEMVSLGREQRTRQRGFISAIKPLLHNEKLYTLSIFGGFVKVLDTETNRIVFSNQGHRGRVWMCENLAPFQFASCADDGFIKLWDLRQKQCLCAVKDHPKISSRVSVLLKLKENELISASCPDNINSSNDKAQFSFWDTRRLV